MKTDVSLLRLERGDHMKPWDEAVATAQEKVWELRALLKVLEITDAEPALDRIEEGIREKEKERTQEERLRYLSKFMTLSALSPDNDEMLTAVQAEVEALIVHRDLDKLAPYEKILHFIEQPEQYDPAGKMRLLMELQKESMQDTLLSCVFFAQGELFFSEEKGREKNPSPAPKTGRSKRDRHGAKHVSTQHSPVTGASAIADIPREKPTKNAEESSTNEIEPKIERRIEPPTGETDRTPHIETVPEGWSVDIPERAGKKFSFSEFQHALSKKTIVEKPYIANITAELTAFGVCSSDTSLMHGEGKKPSDTILIQKAEEFLYRKGYAVRCTFGSRHFLSPSKRLSDGASTEKMRRWSINHTWRSFSSCGYTDAARRILSRLFFVDAMFYLQKYHTAMTPEDYSCVSVEESYTAVLHEKDQILAMTVLSPADEEAFIEALEGRFKDWPSIQRIIVGGLDFAHAGKTAERVQKTFPALHAATVVLYDLQRHYAAYPDMEETDEASAWGLSAGDDTTQASEDERSTNDARESAAPLDASDEVPIDPVKKEPDTIDLQEEEHVYADRQAEAFIADEPTAPGALAQHIEHTPVVQRLEAVHAPALHELCALLQTGKLYSASAYARAAGALDTAWQKLSVRLSYAVHDPMESCRYTGTRLYEVYDADTSDVYGLEAPLFAAAALRACFYNQQAHDYSMKPLYSDVVKRLPLMETLKDLGTAFYQMAQFREQTGLGIDAAADYRRKDKNDLAKEMAAIQMRAEEYRNGYLNPANIKDTASFKRFINTQQLIFSPSGDFAACIQAITDGAVDSDTLDFMRGFLGQFTDEGDLPEESAVSDAALEDFIALHWDKAAETLQHKKNTVRLVSTRLTKLKRRDDRTRIGAHDIAVYFKFAQFIEQIGDLLIDLSLIYAV